jgi:Family of unknown function (DUF6491)
MDQEMLLLEETTMTVRSMTGLLAVSGLLLGTAAQATATSTGVTEVDAGAVAGPTLEAVDHITALRPIHSWKAIDNDSLIIWATAFQPYLVRLVQPTPDLRFAHTIGVSNFAGRIHAGFDSVYVKGLNYRISEIYRLSREDAKTFF